MVIITNKLSKTLLIINPVTVSLVLDQVAEKGDRIVLPLVSFEMLLGVEVQEEDWVLVKTF